MTPMFRMVVWFNVCLLALMLLVSWASGRWGALLGAAIGLALYDTVSFCLHRSFADD